MLPPGHKDIVLAMVKNHTASTSVLGKEGIRQTSEVDLVRGKGTTPFYFISDSID